jgi:hypothetical protein
MYDLSAVYRPWAGRSDRFASSTYFFLGGGGFTSDPAGDGGCELGTLDLGACLVMDGDAGTVGQGTAGVGFSFGTIWGVDIFGELAAHGYDSAVHVGDGFVPTAIVGPGELFTVADDRWALTGRYVAGLKYSFGNLVPRPAPYEPPPPPMAPPPPPAMTAIAVCVVEGSGLRTVQAMFNPATRDTLVDGEPFAERYPATAPTYAAGASWFISSDTLRLSNKTYVKFGVTRRVPPEQLRSVGAVMGTSVFAESNAAAPQSVVYVPVRPGCEFQPYAERQTIRPRG